MELRPYQNDFITNIRRTLQHSKKIIACSPTGSGKTVVFSKIIIDAHKKKFTTLVITESRKIFKQITEKVNGIEINAGCIIDIIDDGKVYIAMAQTLGAKKRQHLICQFAKKQLLVIVDEAHIATPTKILLQLNNAYIIGFTATPDYRVAKHLPIIYNSIAIGMQPAKLVEMGFLAKYRHFERKAINQSLLTQKGGEFTEDSQYAEFVKPKVFDGLFEDLKEHNFKKAIIFCSSIKHCKMLVQKFRNMNFKVAEVHSENPNEHFERMQFETNDTDICCSVGILTKGYDYPPIDLVILQRATTSLALFLQMIGRGSRIFEGKEFFKVLDYGGNATRLGLWDFDYDWGTMWLEQKKKKKGIAAVKECSKCGLLLALNTKICIECGYEFKQKKKKEEEEQETILVELTKSVKYYKDNGGKVHASLYTAISTLLSKNKKSSFEQIQILFAPILASFQKSIGRINTANNKQFWNNELKKKYESTI